MKKIFVVRKSKPNEKYRGYAIVAESVFNRMDKDTIEYYEPVLDRPFNKYEEETIRERVIETQSKSTKFKESKK